MEIIRYFADIKKELVSGDEESGITLSIKAEFYKPDPHLPQNFTFGGNVSPHRRHTRSTDGGIDCCSVGAVCCETGAGEIPVPHRPQNLVFAGSMAEHRGQLIVAGCWAGLTIANEPFPQRPQNLTPSANLAPHREHATIPGITLDCPALLLPS